MKFIFLYKNELVVLLNNHEVPVTISERLICEGLIPEQANFVEKLLSLPQFEYDEDILLIECEETNENILKIENIKKLIPLTEKSWLAYQRKFKSNLKFSDPRDENYDKMFVTYREERISKETKRAVELCQKYFLRSNDIIDADMLEKLIKANIDRRIYAKNATKIETAEYDDFFQSLFIYQDSSNFDRTYPVGFVLHLLASFYCHLGKCPNISNLKQNSPAIKFLRSEKNNNWFKSIEGVLEYLSKEKSLEDVVKAFREKAKTSLSGDSLKIGLYTLYFRYLLNQDFSFKDLVTVFNHWKITPTVEMKTAILLNAAYFPFTKIGDECLAIKNKEIFNDTVLSNIKEKLNLVTPFLTTRKEKEEEQRIQNQNEKHRKACMKYEEVLEGFGKKGFVKLEKNDQELKSHYIFETVNPPLGEEEVWGKKKTSSGVQLTISDEIDRDGVGKKDVVSDWKFMVYEQIQREIDKEEGSTSSNLSNSFFEKLVKEYKKHLKDHCNKKSVGVIKGKPLLIEIHKNYLDDSFTKPQ
jgi:hypothetical protein